MKKSCFLFLVFIFSHIIIPESIPEIRAQNEDKAVAKIGNIPISEKEFRLRYELSPHIGLHQKGIRKALRESFLYTLAAEKLLALEAKEKMLDTNEVVRYTLKEFEKMFVRDALYKEVIRRKAEAKADSLVSRYAAAPLSFRGIYIYDDNAIAINRIFNLLEEGIPFDTLYSGLSSGREDTLNIRIGDLEEDNEAEILRTGENSVTRPLYLTTGYAPADGWYIIKIIKRDSPLLARPEGWESEYKRLKKTAEERAEGEIFNQFYTDFFAGKKVNANAVLMKSIAVKISALLSLKDTSKTDKRFLDAADLFRVNEMFGPDSLDLPYIRFEDRTISLKDFLRYFRIENLYSSEAEYETILSLLNNKTQKFIREEMFAEEGYRRGLQNSDEVRESYNMWADNYLSQIARAGVMIPEVTEDELIKEYEKYSERKNIKLNILEIVTPDLEVMEDILNRINSGEDMHQLAKEYSGEGTGESGLLPLSMHGEIGRIAAEMETGEIYGPHKVPEGYSIFQLIDKQEEAVKQVPAFDEIRNELINELAEKNFKTDLNEYTVNLALKYGMDIDYELLHSMPLTNINVVGFRYLGFGSRITAVPLLPPNADWVIPWLKRKNLIQ